MAGNGSEPRRSVASKLVAILRTFASGGSLTITEIAQAANLPLSTTHRLTRELAEWGLLGRGDDGRYQLSALGCPPDEQGSRPDLRVAAAPLVEDLSVLTHGDVRLGVLDGTHVRYAEKIHGCRPLGMFSDAATLPAHATAIGRALLAFSAPETVDHVIGSGLRRYTAHTIATTTGLRKALKLVKLNGMAIVHDELLIGHTALAVPAFGVGGEVAAALEVRLRDVRAELRNVVPALTLAARALSRELCRSTSFPPAPDTRRTWRPQSVRLTARAVHPMNAADRSAGRLSATERRS